MFPPVQLSEFLQTTLTDEASKKYGGGGHSTHSKSCISSQAENDVIVAYAQTNLMDYSGGFEMLLQESGDTSFQAMPYNQVHLLDFSVYRFEEQVTKARH